MATSSRRITVSPLILMAGDQLQSAASRLAEYVRSLDDVPYEVRMAAHEARSAVHEWTDARLSAAFAEKEIRRG